MKYTLIASLSLGLLAAFFSGGLSLIWQPTETTEEGKAAVATVATIALCAVASAIVLGALFWLILRPHKTASLIKGFIAGGLTVLAAFPVAGGLAACAHVNEGPSLEAFEAGAIFGGLALTCWGLPMIPMAGALGLGIASLSRKDLPADDEDATADGA